MSLGKKIKLERLEKGYTQEELGEKVDCTGRYIGQIERGERNASLSKVVLIAKTLNASVDYLVNNFLIESSDNIEIKLANELKSISNKQKEMVIEVIKVIKKLYYFNF